MALAAKASHPGCLGECAARVMGVQGLWRAPGLARGWILGQVRSSEEGMKRGDAVFMPRGAFAAGRGLPGLRVCIELRARTHLGRRPQCPTSSHALVAGLSHLIEDG